jgi:hypothetical protein
LVLGFSRDGARPAITGISAVDGAADRHAALAGGLAVRCGLSGLVPRTESDCTATTFFSLRQAPQAPKTGGSNSAHSGSNSHWNAVNRLALAGAVSLALSLAVAGLAVVRRCRPRPSHR